jgi:hypothetical protein
VSVAPQAQRGDSGGTGSALLSLKSAEYLPGKLHEAEMLLGYAAEVGIEVEDKVRQDVLKARLESAGDGMTALAANARPATVQSLKYHADANKVSRNEVRIYGFLSIVFAVCILPVFYAFLGAAPTSCACMRTRLRTLSLPTSFVELVKLD